MVHSHGVGGILAGGAARSGRGHGGGSLAAMAAVGQLVEVQAAGKLRLLEVGSDVLVRHLLHAGLEEVVLLFLRPRTVATCRHLASTEAGRVGRLRIHLGEGREDLGLMVEHCR